MDSVQLDIQGLPHTQIRLEGGVDPRVTALAGYELADRPVDPTFAHRFLDRTAAVLRGLPPAGRGRYQLTLQLGTSVLTRSWTDPVPAGWEPAAELAHALIQLAGAGASGHLPD